MTTDLTITAAAIATLISSLTTAGITTWVAGTNKKKSLDDQLDNVLRIAVQYPYLESGDFVSSWKSELSKGDEKCLRYDLYCNLLFNFLSRVATHYNYKKKKIENYVTIKDWVRHHRNYWLDPDITYENMDGYDQRFKKLIDSYLK